MATNPADEPTAAAVAAQAETILTSEEFARSKRGRELFRYIVDEALAGRGDRISATTIAQDVLGRDDDFDSGTDPLVRVQMGRLRTLLAGWYEAHGAEATVVIDVPKGTYEPTFALNDGASPAPDGAPDEAKPMAPSPAARPAPTTVPHDPQVSRGNLFSSLRPGHMIAAALCAVLLGAAIVAMIAAPPLRRQSAYPVLLVKPFENLTGVATNDALSTGLQRQLASDLQRFRTVRVAVEDTKAEPAPPPNDRRRRGRRLIEAPPKADYALAGSILSVDDEFDFVIDLVDLSDGSILDRRRVRGETGNDYYAVIAELSQTATGRLVGGGGSLDRAEQERLSDAMGMPDTGELASFRCLVLFEEFVRLKTPQGAKATYDCLDDALATNPRDSSLIAALGWVTFLVAPEAGQVQAGDWADELTLADGLALAERAVSVGPGNDFAHEHLGLMQWRLGETQAAIASLRRAAALNPGNPHLSADLALYLAFDGKWAASERMANEAFERSGDPPNWYYLPAFYAALIEGDADTAQEAAAIVAPGDPFGPIYEFAAAVLAKDDDRIAALKPIVADAAKRSGGDPLRDARPWIRSDQVLGVLEELIIEGGVALRG